MTLKGERRKDIFSINGTFLKKTYSNVFTLGLLDQKIEILYSPSETLHAMLKLIKQDP